MTKKRLVQINTVINTGSTGRIAEEIGAKAITNGWDSYIAFGRNEKISKSYKLKIGNDWDIRMHGIQTRLFDNHGFASTSATQEFVRKLDKIHPDIVHLHNLHGYYLNIKILMDYLRKTDIPVVWTFHDCWPITGHCVYFDYVGCDKWKTQCCKCPQKSTYPSSYFIDRSVKNFNLKKDLFRSLPNLMIIPVSNWLTDIVAKSFLKNYPIKVIHNGVDTEKFKPFHEDTLRKKYNLEGKFILTGVAGVWSPRKGLHDFIEISSRLSFDCQIVLVGLSRKQIRTLPKNIIGIEQTESINQLAEIYSTSDVFLNLTYEDNFPTTNIEALACGTPVITYRTGGSPEAITPDTGFVIDKGDLLSLRKTIDTIKGKGKESYTKACRLRAETMFNKNDRYNEYIELYENLL
ncbi:glycosyltransferase [Proteiniphilum saccharofermentans]|uniref:glycosyltransferase n=1 Tax=Proteiniphilum saccharofermentans TaxID=1642647 RepID=UPI0028A6192E|nr:glycosyltransferase [Proteiniphilum saccharofermentans]